MLIAREKEIKEIKDALHSIKMESVLIYGKRGVGKTSILLEAYKGTNLVVVHYECKRVSLQTNLELITELFVSQLKLPQIKFDNFNAFFEYVFSFSETRKFVLIIDEFSFLLEKDFAIESYLASAIDMHKEYSQIKLIISGSYVGLMEKMIEYGSHSYGRFNHILIIRPFDYYLSSKFYPKYSDEDKFIAYSVFGGLPYFNSLIDPKKSIEENIKNLIIKPDSILELELNQMILEEINCINNFNDAIRLIASGKTKRSDLFSCLKNYGLNDPKYLFNKMQDLDIVEKCTPINEKNNKKKTFFRFKDNFFAFYFKYIALSPFSAMRVRPVYFYKTFIEKDFKANYLPRKFEDLSREFLFRFNYLGKINPPLMDVGTYFYDDKKLKINRQFDVVTLDENGYISYECKYSNRKVDNKVIEEEIRQSKDLEIEFYKLGFISKSGFDKEVDKVKYNLFTLADFYK